MSVGEITSNIIAFLALVLALVSFIRTWKVTSLQKQVSELELQIKEIDLANKELQEEMKAKAICSIKAICDGRDRRLLKITNTGLAEAYEVSSELLDAESKQCSGLFRFEDIEPYECLQPEQSYDVLVTNTWGFPDKFSVRLHWKNPDGISQEKDFVLSF